MPINADTLNSLVPITQFNKGQAAKIFDRLKTEGQLVVLKNNAPSAVILSLEEYVRMSKAEKDLHLLQSAKKRISDNGRSENAIAEENFTKASGAIGEDIEDSEDA
ncbi:MAG: type II toxin-antitoxin system Phd/YefM family antitoxin [Clostridiales Family XIII bacterium]|jgi:PHD/YefM family antitoxin component YafN of YafNO toxin-antitoxin module|nr:type II toxin-antitoxin system Phd/YefM family antitoxin [Clostridiales Family XIII bacterium]